MFRLPLHVDAPHGSYYQSKLVPLIAASGVSVIAKPLINITLQGRHETPIPGGAA